MSNSMTEALKKVGLLTSGAEKAQQVKEGQELLAQEKKQKDGRLFTKRGMPRIDDDTFQIFDK
jgi:hypothetical protein